MPSHPEHLCGHPRFIRTLPLTSAGVPPLSLCRQEIARPCARVDGGGLNDNTAILYELLDVGARVGVTNFGLLSGVEPYFAFAYTRDACGKAFLGPEID